MIRFSFYNLKVAIFIFTIINYQFSTKHKKNKRFCLKHLPTDPEYKLEQSINQKDPSRNYRARSPVQRVEGNYSPPGPRLKKPLRNT